MSKKVKTPKLRYGWEINPKTRVVPGKKREPIVCNACGGVGMLLMAGITEDCTRCEGTGYAN